GPAHERAPPGGRPSVLRAATARASRHARRARVRATAHAVARRARSSPERRRDLDGASGRVLAATDAAGGHERERATAESAPARRGAGARTLIKGDGTWRNSTD